MAEKLLRISELGWNPILEIMETSHILARRSHEKIRNFEAEEKESERINKKFAKHHGKERVDCKINVSADPGSKDFIEGFYIGFQKLGDANLWCLVFERNDEYVYLPAENLENSTQIVYFRTYPKENVGFPA